MSKKYLLTYLIISIVFFVLLLVHYLYTNKLIYNSTLALVSIITSAIISIICLILLIIKKQIIDKVIKTIVDYGLFIFTSLVVLVFVFNFLFKRAVVDGISMKPTLNDNQSVMLFSNPFIKISNNDIVAVFNTIDNKFLVKRVFASPGDEVVLIYEDAKYRIINLTTNVIHPGNNITNETKGITIDEWIMISGLEGGYEPGSSFIVPTDKYLCLGDNFDHSSDSRNYGLFAREFILGKVLFHD